MFLSEILPWTGEYRVSGIQVYPGENLLSSIFSGGYWSVAGPNRPSNYNLSTSYLTREIPAIYGYNIGHYYVLGSKNTSSGDHLDHGLLSPRDARSLDMKMDDGVMYEGKVMVRPGVGGTGAGCQIDNGGDVYSYDLMSTQKSCILFFKTQGQ